MKFNELETEYARIANVAESAAHQTDDDAKAAAAVVRDEGNQQWNETLTDSALALALLPSMPKAWQEKAVRGTLPKDPVTGVLDGRKRGKNWQARATAIVRGSLDSVYGRKPEASYAGAPRRIGGAVMGLLESAEVLPVVQRIAADRDSEGKELDTPRTMTQKIERLAAFLTTEVDIGSGLTLDSRAARSGYAKRGAKPEGALDSALEKFFRSLTESPTRDKEFDAALKASQTRTLAKVIAAAAAKAANDRTEKAEKAAKKVA